MDLRQEPGAGKSPLFQALDYKRNLDDLHIDRLPERKIVGPELFGCLVLPSVQRLLPDLPLLAINRRPPPLPVRQGGADVTQMNESAAERLTPVRAAELAQVLDLQSRWENLRADGKDSTAHLQSLQTAFEAYRVRMAAYTAQDRSEPIPELSPTKPGRLGVWCGTVRAVLRRAESGDCPTHIVAKAHRVADQIAVRLKSEQGGWETPKDMAGAIRQFDMVIAWCDGLAGKPRPPEAAAYEVGDRSCGL